PGVFQFSNILFDFRGKIIQRGINRAKAVRVLNIKRIPKSPRFYIDATHISRSDGAHGEANSLLGLDVDPAVIMIRTQFAKTSRKDKRNIQRIDESMRRNGMLSI